MPAGADSYPGVLKELNISSPEKDFPIRKVIIWTPDVSADQFSQVVTLAGYFVIDDLTNAYGIKPNNSNKIKYQDPSNFLNKANKIRWFLAESNQEYTTLIRGQADQWAKKLKTVKAKYVTSKLPGGHSYAFVTSEMAPVTTWFAWGKN
jgi:S-formylglutathione hydrolase FrmB